MKFISKVDMESCILRLVRFQEPTVVNASRDTVVLRGFLNFAYFASSPSFHRLPLQLVVTRLYKPERDRVNIGSR